MKWRLKKIVEEEERNEAMVVLSYRKIRVNNKWWYWDEREKVIQDENENYKGEKKRGTGREGNEEEGL